MLCIVHKYSVVSWPNALSISSNNTEHLLANVVYCSQVFSGIVQRMFKCSENVQMFRECSNVQMVKRSNKAGTGK